MLMLPRSVRKLCNFFFLFRKGANSTTANQENDSKDYQWCKLCNNSKEKNNIKKDARG